MSVVDGDGLVEGVGLWMEALRAEDQLENAGEAGGVREEGLGSS